MFILLALSRRDAHTATSLNMSTDLVTLGIASQNLTPNNPSLDARPLFQAAVQYIRSHPVQLLTLNTGSYYFLTPQNTTAYLGFAARTDLTVDLAGSSIYFKDYAEQGFSAPACRRFTLTNFQTDYITPPYTHVQLTSVNPQQRTLAYRTLNGFPDPTTFNTPIPSALGTSVLWAVIFRNGKILPGTTRMSVARPIAQGVLTLTQDQTPWTQSGTLSTFQAGDIIAVTQRGGGGPPVLVNGGDAVTLSNITVHGSPAFAVGMFNLTNSVADHVRVMPRAVTGLIGSNADGIHFVTSLKNNHIRNCYVTRTLDDALAMDSLDLATVASITGPRQITVTRSFAMAFPNGTAVNFVRTSNAQEVAGGTIVSQNPPDSSTPVAFGQVQLTFDRDLPTLVVGDGMVFGTDDLRGAGSTVEDNTVEDLPFGHGLFIGGIHAITIQRNVFRGTSYSGIAITSETRFFPGPGARDVTIANNVLQGNLGPQATGSGSQTGLGAITVVSTDVTSKFATTFPNTNISITGNYVADSGRSGIWIESTSGLTIQNNLIVRWYQHPELPFFGIGDTQTLAQNIKQPVFVENSQGVTQSNNITNMQSTLNGAVLLNPASGIFGLAGGTGSISVQVNLPNFAWSAASDSPWLTVNAGASGKGPGTVSFTVAPNDGPARSGAITVAGIAFAVTQGTTVAANAPSIFFGAIVNAASYCWNKAGGGSVTGLRTINQDR